MLVKVNGEPHWSHWKEMTHADIIAIQSIGKTESLRVTLAWNSLMVYYQLSIALPPFSRDRTYPTPGIISITSTVDNIIQIMLPPCNRERQSTVLMILVSGKSFQTDIVIGIEVLHHRVPAGQAGSIAWD